MASATIQQHRAAYVLDQVRDYPGFGILTRRAFLTRALAQGARANVSSVADDATRARLQKRCDYLARNCPFGNECHPETKEWRALQATLSQPITKAAYRLWITADRCFVLTKTEFDFCQSVPVPEVAR